MELAEVYQVDSTTCARLASAYSGYADSLGREPENDRQRRDVVGSREYRASCKAIAAAYFALTDPARARETFAEAAELYLQLGRPFAAALAVCAQEPVILERCRESWEHVQARAAGPEQLLCHALLVAMPVAAGQEVRQRSEPYGWQDDVERYRWQPVGRLGLSLEHYLSLLDSARRLSWPSGDASSSFQQAIVRFLRRAAEGNAGAMQTGYLWRHMLTARLPAEPEILAALVIAVISWRGTARRQGKHLSEELGGLGLQGIEIAPLLVAEQLVEAGTDPWLATGR